MQSSRHLSLSTCSLSPQSPSGTWGEFPKVTCSLHPQINHRRVILTKSHLPSPPKKRTVGIPCALHQCNYAICLHVCEFRVYVEGPCHFKLWGFAQIQLCFLMKQIYLLAFRGFPQLIVWLWLHHLTHPLFHFPFIVCNVMTKNERQQ